MATRIGLDGMAADRGESSLAGSGARGFSRKSRMEERGRDARSQRLGLNQPLLSLGPGNPMPALRLSPP